ncbi:DUF2325 domain-containing protein [Variovorax sp. RKNM96]|uniref:DUF2325 domain-containing protein n=1 Tax=Variovorax sp. RKNM96 TaxID=2681552 RepID=UPI00198160FC|nr:DUF2325 domain-containing protein [Variovorax sp. RKNM96]QSI31150.1 DUF2325 domain-containing protein [Variovorax sp. RKNM96]
MQNPPFRRLASANTAPATLDGPALQHAASCCEPPEGDDETPNGRIRLLDLDTNFYCSVIGTCLTTAELRKLIARFADVQGASDLHIHHEAVRMATQNPIVTKALQKALDHRHAAAIQRLSTLHDVQALTAHWEEALHQGEIPGSYWAVLMHRRATAELRNRAFGDIHMLSHLVGAANRADIRRLAALERDNLELRDRLDRHQLRSQELIEERDKSILHLKQELIDASRARAMASASTAGDVSTRARLEETEKAAVLIAVQTERRERAEQASAFAATEVARLTEELEHLRAHAVALGRELGAAETQLKMHAGEGVSNAQLDQQLQGRRVLYVGGRPSSAPAIRDLVQRHGGEFRRHGGALEDRSGLLAAAVSWAEVVVFPVDCIDHESVDNLKRLCTRQQVRYLPLRSAGIASFAAAFSNPPVEDAGEADTSSSPICPRHG